MMSIPSQVVLSRLSRDLYEEFLAKARERGFAFVRFADFLPDGPTLPERFILLRHDIDFAPEYSLEMAQLEHAAGVAATYFVLVDGEFYDPLRPEIVRQLRQILALGHEIGLHFAASNAADPADLGGEVAFRMGVLSAVVGRPVNSFSQHDPVNSGFANIALPRGRDAWVDAREVIREHDLLYVSDSAMMWRNHTFDTALDEDRNLCLLAHSHSWLHPQDDYVAMVRGFQAEQVDAVSRRFDIFVGNLKDYYRRRLEEGV